MKALLYRYNESIYDKMFKSPDPYNLSVVDVDFSAEPQEVEFYNFVTGTKTEYRKELVHMPMISSYGDSIMLGSNSYTATKSYEVPCLMAVVGINGTIIQVEAYRIKIPEK